tara:strand:- start:2048 stop:2311 length:264 start_codon:yes stop_codon:yes gene_type:complete
MDIIDSYLDKTFIWENIIGKHDQVFTIICEYKGAWTGEHKYVIIENQNGHRETFSIEGIIRCLEAGELFEVTDTSKLEDMIQIIKIS